jgi:signal transduction histidine kinase
MRSVLVLPLRAHYDNYGVLIYASEMPDAFSEDHIHALNTVARQATVALQNAVLYDSLLADKRRIIQMEEDARKALVRDLHDVPTQTVSAIKMRLSITRRMVETGKGDLGNELSEIEDMAQRASEELRHVLFKLRPLALESQGLTAALGQLAEKVKQTFQQNMVVKVAPDFEHYLDEQQQGALFYLIEEAVNNARKYAEASTIGVQAGRQNNMLVVRIIDNGKGFDADAVNAGYDKRGSFGMVNMRERAELLDGSLQLKSAPGQGTQITVFIPLKQKQTKQSEGNGKAASPMAATKLATSARGAIERMRYD